MIMLVLGGVVALGIGIWLGMPGDSRSTELEIEKAIRENRGGGPSKRVRRQFMAVEWLMRRGKESEVRKSRESTRRPFNLTAGDDRPKKGSE